MPVVVARDLLKSYPNAAEPVVRSISFAVEERECFGFLGPNGAGKTTTMRMLSCRTRRSGGRLEVMGLDPDASARDIKARIGIVPQENYLDTDLSVEENLVIYAGYFGMKRGEAQERAAEVLEFVQLTDRKDWNTEHLSGGMKRRLLIARGLINDPSLLVLDEPTTGLDPQARHLVWERLRELKRRGVTLVITTHYMEEAAQLCDRLVIMHEGSILVEGPPGDLVRRHVAPEVLELTASSPDALQALAEAVAGYASAHEVTGDRILLHTDGGEVLLKTVNDSGAGYETATFRQASLEDVFLKLTGRSLGE